MVVAPIVIGVILFLAFDAYVVTKGPLRPAQV
jgi:hypothetical protein